jgi:hypothetical protein
VANSGAGRGHSGASDPRCAQFPFRVSGNEEYANKLLSAMRYEFGDHKKKAGDKQEAA